jgi:hypothetical protein
MNTPYPHADLLRAIADGQPLEQLNRVHEWHPVSPGCALVAISQDMASGLRLKPATIWIGLREVAAPLCIEPSHGSRYFVPTLGDSDGCFSSRWDSDRYDDHRFRSGLCFSSQADAEAVAKALFFLLAPKGAQA